MKCPQHYLTEIHEVILFYNGLDIPTRQILDSRGAIPSKTVADAKTAIQEIAAYSQKWHNRISRTRSTKTSDGLAAIQAQLNNLGRETKKVNKKVYAAQVGCEQCKGPHYTKDCPLKDEGKTIEEAYYTQFGRPFQCGGYRATALGFYERNNANPSYYYEGKKRSYGPQFLEAYSKASHINNSIPRKEKDLRSFTLPCFINNVCFDNALVDLGASISVMPLSTHLNLGLGELAHTKLTVELADRTMKYLKGIAKNVLVGIGKFTSLSLDPLNGDYIKLNDLNEPFELRRNQGNDLMPTIEEGEVIKEFKARNDARMISEIFGYPSYDHDKKIRIDYAYNLKFSCMIGFEFLHANVFPILYVIVMSKKFHNSIMKEKLEYKGNNVVGALMNVPIFVGTFSVMTDFAVLEDMDDYRDKGMSDVIFGESFLREVGIKARRFDAMITIYNVNDEVSEEDEMNGISHAYQKLKVYTKEF
ncbi:hypothetical protein Tco_0936527 [Tanacetum coccineum]